MGKGAAGGRREVGMMMAYSRVSHLTWPLSVGFRPTSAFHEVEKIYLTIIQDLLVKHSGHELRNSARSNLTTQAVFANPQVRSPLHLHLHLHLVGFLADMFLVRCFKLLLSIRWGFRRMRLLSWFPPGTSLWMRSGHRSF